MGVAVGGGVFFTCTGGRVWLPEEAVVDLSAGDLGRPLQDVAGVALEDHAVARLTAVPAARAVGGGTRVVTGRGCGD